MKLVGLLLVGVGSGAFLYSVCRFVEERLSGKDEQ